MQNCTAIPKTIECQRHYGPLWSLSIGLYPCSLPIVLRMVPYTASYTITLSLLRQHLVPRDIESPTIPPNFAIWGQQKRLFDGNVPTPSIKIWTKSPPLVNQNFLLGFVQIPRMDLETSGRIKPQIHPVTSPVNKPTTTGAFMVILVS